MKKTENKINPDRLAEIIKRWKINLPMLSKEIQMPASTLKNKLNPALPQYNFTLAEYSAILRAISSQMISILDFAKKETRRISIYDSNSK